jgi:hypothetical protein
MDFIGPDGTVYHNVPKDADWRSYGLEPFNGVKPIRPDYIPGQEPPEKESTKPQAMANAFLDELSNGPITKRALDSIPALAKLRQGIHERRGQGETENPNSGLVGAAGFAGDMLSPESMASGYVGGKLLGKLKDAIQSRAIAKTAPSLGIGTVNIAQPAERRIAEGMLTQPGAALSTEAAGKAAKPAIGAAIGTAAGANMGPLGAEGGGYLGAMMGGAEAPRGGSFASHMFFPERVMANGITNPAVQYQAARPLPFLGDVAGRFAIPPWLKSMDEQK